MAPRRTPSKKPLLWLVIILLVGLLAAWIFHRPAAAPTKPAAAPHQAATSKPAAPQAAAFNFSAHSLTDPSSIWVIVNKHNPLNPKDYTPTITLPNVALKYSKDTESMHVSSVMAPPLEALFAAATKAGYHLRLSSGYRSYAYQVKVYGSEVKAYGQPHADAESARPGYSEHQTGLAADVSPTSGKCDLSQCFGTTPEGIWLAGNAYRYGFVIRYPKGKEAITGYEYEPWHIRYIGTAAATEMHRTGIQTLEEFFNLEPAPNYQG